jgi:hypothetical protein
MNTSIMSQKTIAQATDNATVTPKLPVHGAERLGEPHMLVTPCDEARCLFKGGHVVEDYDPDFLHYAFQIKEPGFDIDVNRPSFGTTWNVWASLDCDDGRTSSAVAREFTAALEIAEDIAAELNAKAGQ